MPTRPRGQKRPADAIGNAVKVMRIATEEEPEDFGLAKPGKNEAAASLGRAGGRKRAENLTAEQRLAIAKNAAKSRWKEHPVPAEEE